MRQYIIQIDNYREEGELYDFRVLDSGKEVIFTCLDACLVPGMEAVNQAITKALYDDPLE